MPRLPLRKENKFTVLQSSLIFHSFEWKMDIRLLNILNFKPSQEVSMTRGEERIGDLYHQETKYWRNAMPRGGLDWAHQPSPYKEFSPALKHVSINPPEQKGSPSSSCRSTARSHSSSSSTAPTGRCSSATWTRIRTSAIGPSPR